MRGRTIEPETIDDMAEAPGRRARSLEELYLRHAPEAVRLAFLLTRDGEAAQDIAQEAFIRVAGRFGHLRSAGAFDSYFRRTLVNLCMTHHRKRKVADAYLERERGWIGRVDPAVPAADIETRNELRDVLASLPDRQRAAVVLRFYLDQTEEQTAATLGCSVTAARSLVHRAMKTLRERIGDER